MFLYEAELLYMSSRSTESPYNLLAHVFEEVEVSQVNAKQDPSGLRPVPRLFSLLLTRFSEVAIWKCSPLIHKVTGFFVVVVANSFGTNRLFFNTPQQIAKL